MWYRISQSVFNQTSETNEEWLQRHQFQKEGDKYVFYHVSRIYLNVLRAKSLLATTPEEATDFGDTNFFNDRRKSLIIYKVLVSPEEIVPGYWASLINDHPVSVLYKIKKKVK